MRKIRFINVSSSSGQAMRARADNPIAIHHQAGRYTTIAPLSLIIFFFFAPLRFSVFAFQNRVRHGCLPSSHPAVPPWMASGATRGEPVVIIYQVPSSRTDTVSKIATLCWCSPGSRFVADENPTIPRHRILKNHCAKNFRWRRQDLKHYRISRSLLLYPFIGLINHKFSLY